MGLCINILVDQLSINGLNQTQISNPCKASLRMPVSKAREEGKYHCMVAIGRPITSLTQHLWYVLLQSMNACMYSPQQNRVGPSSNERQYCGLLSSKCRDNTSVNTRYIPGDKCSAKVYLQQCIPLLQTEANY